MWPFRKGWKRGRKGGHGLCQIVGLQYNYFENCTDTGVCTVYCKMACGLHAMLQRRCTKKKPKHECELAKKRTFYHSFFFLSQNTSLSFFLLCSILVGIVDGAPGVLISPPSRLKRKFRVYMRVYYILRTCKSLTCWLIYTFLNNKYLWLIAFPRFPIRQCGPMFCPTNRTFGVHKVKQFEAVTLGRPRPRGIILNPV